MVPEGFALCSQTLRPALDPETASGECGLWVGQLQQEARGRVEAEAGELIPPG